MLGDMPGLAVVHRRLGEAVEDMDLDPVVGDTLQEAYNHLGLIVGMVHVSRGMRASQNIYMQPKVRTWFEDFVTTEFMAEQWKQSFRMSREHFFELVQILSPRLQGVGCNAKAPTPVPLKVAVF